MAFSRKFLKALGIEDEKIDTIIEEHTAVTSGLTADRDKYKTEADKVPDLQKKLEEAQKKAAGDGEYKQKYEQLVSENQAKETRKTKTAAYRELLKGINIGDQYIDLIIRANGKDIDSLELDDSGKPKDAETVTKGLKESLSQYIVKRGSKGPTTPKPPKENGGKAMTRDEIMAIEDRDERRNAIAENIELFQ